MLLHTGGSTRGWGENVCESSRSHLNNASSFTWVQTQVPQRIPFIPRAAGSARACPANSPSRCLCTSARPGQLPHGRGHSRQWTTRGRKNSQKQPATALAQPTPWLYLLRGFDSVQILEKNRKYFTCYLIWSSCWAVPGEPCGSGQVPPGRLWSCCQRGVWGQAKHISSSPGMSHSTTSPISTIFPFLLFHPCLGRHRAGK